MAAAELTLAGTNPTPLEHRQGTAVDPFEPQDWGGLLQLAEMVSKTDFAPPVFRGKPEACAIAMMYGKQIGIPALQALQNVAVINGRPSLWGDALWAVILSHPELEEVEEKEENTEAWVKLKRRGRAPREITFTKGDAETAKLWGKAGPWQQYPKAMLLWRARTTCARAVFPDALKGITSSYEAEDSGPIIDTPSLHRGNGPEPKQFIGQAPSMLPQKITQDTARQFAGAWKQSGYSIVQARAKLKEIAGVESSLDVTVDKIEMLMRWATRNPNWPNVAPEPEPVTDEKLCRKLFSVLGSDLQKQADAITNHTANGSTDWVALSVELKKKLPEEK